MKSEFKWNRIICGDVLEEMKNIPSNSIHLIITSPLIMLVRIMITIMIV